MPDETANQARDEVTYQGGLETILAEYLRAVEAGITPNESELLQRYPELAPDLRSFFENRREMEQVARPLRIAGGPARPSTRHQRIKYLGDYELLDQIGSGGMGVIFKARQTSLQRIVAVKMVLDDRLPTSEDRQRFRIEAEAAASLEHPNILPIHEVGEHEGRQYFSMKLVEGGSLSQRLANGPLTVREAANLMITVARAVQFAHEHGILHRDLKPANILIDTGGEPFVADFGLAKRLKSESDLTHTGAVLGTPSYMAPEQAAGQNQNVTTATDVYGLGAILYAAMTGRAPFQGDSVPDTLRRVLEQDPDRPRTLNAAIDGDLETICLKALRKTPTERYATPQLLADDLQRWLRGEPIMARPVGRSERLVRWCRRRPAVTIAIGLGILAGLSFLALAIGIPIAREQARLNTQLRKEQNNTNRALNKADRLTAILAMTQGFTHCEGGDAAQGLHWYSRALELLPANEPVLDSVLRKNISSWMGEVHVLEAMLPHEREVMSLATRRDGAEAAVGCWDGSVVLWDTTTGTQIGETLHHRSPVMAITYCHDRPWLATGCKDGSISIWRLDDQQLLREWRAHRDQVTGLAFAFESGVLISASKDAFVKRWDPPTGNPVGEPLAHDNPVTCLAVSRNGKLVLSGGESPRLFHWDLTEEHPTKTVIEHVGPVMRVALSPDESRYVVGYHAGGAQIWDLASRAQQGRALEHSGRITGLAFSADGRHVLTASRDKTARVWDAESGLPRGAPLWHGDEVSGIAMLPDGRTIVTSSEDRYLRFWSVARVHQGAARQAPPVPSDPSHPDARQHWSSRQFFGMRWRDGGYTQLAGVSPNGRIAYTMGDDAIELDQTSSLQLRRTGTGAAVAKPLKHCRQVTDIAFSPHGKHIATSGGDRLGIWDEHSGESLLAPEAKPVGRALAFSPDGKKILAAAGRKLHFWKCPDGLPLHPPWQSEKKIDYALYNHAGDGIALALAGGEVQIRSAGRGDLLFALPAAAGASISSLVFSADDSLLVISDWAGTVRVWELTGAQPTSIRLEHHEPVWAALISPDGRLVATASSAGVVRIWNIKTGELIGTPLRGSMFVNDLAFSPDSAMIVVGEERFLRIIDSATCLPLGPAMHSPRSVEHVGFSVDGRNYRGVDNRCALRWYVSPAPQAGTLAEIRSQLQVCTGLCSTATV